MTTPDSRNIKNIRNNKDKKKTIKYKKTLASSSKKKINKSIYRFFNNFTHLKKSFSYNFIFWITAFLSIIYLSKIHPNNSIKIGFFSFLLAMIIGWKVHYISHNIDYTALYLKLYNQKHSYFRSFIDYFHLHHVMLNLFLFTLDFHDHIHHDSSVNKKWHFILNEFIQNVFMEGGIIVLFSFYFKISSSFNHFVIWMWAFLYATVHNINYLIIRPDCHIEHHLNEQTNFGIDTLDILFNSKYDVSNVEIFNHAAINIVIITLILTFLIKYKNNNPFILFFKSFL